MLAILSSEKGEDLRHLPPRKGEWGRGGTNGSSRLLKGRCFSLRKKNEWDILLISFE